jgi:hypothetical protein
MKKPENWINLPFYEKIRIYGLSLTEFHAKYTDKLNAKEIIKREVREIKTAEVIKILDSPRDLTMKDFGSKIIKSVHASGWNIKLNVFPSIEKINEIKKKLKMWNKKYKPTTERNYSFIEPKFFIEEMLEDKIAKDSLMVYMIRCINSEPISIGVKYKDKQNSYDLKWNKIYSELFFEIPKPDELEMLLNISRRLSKPFEFVRLDYFITNKGVYFSEFTFVPNAGLPVFPEEMEYELGKLWKK